MTWFKVDDKLATHPKVLQAGLPAMGLWVCAGSWSAAHLTDGHVSAVAVRSLGGTRAQTRALVNAGLWEECDDGFRFRDWLEYQPSARDVKLNREAESTAGRRGNHERWHVRRHLVDPECPYCASG